MSLRAPINGRFCWVGLLSRQKSFCPEDEFSGCTVLSSSAPHGPVQFHMQILVIPCCVPSHQPGTADPLKGAQGSVLDVLTVWKGSDDNDQTTYIHGTLASCVPGTTPRA